MAQFDLITIEVLFRLCLAKAQVSRDRRGFSQLKTALDKELKQETPIQQKYLDENLHKQLVKRLETDEKVARLNADYLNYLALFLGYESLHNFETRAREISGALEDSTFSSFRLYYTIESEDKVKDFMKALYYPNQENALDTALITVDKAEGLVEELNKDDPDDLKIGVVPFTWINDPPLSGLIEKPENPMVISCFAEEISPPQVLSKKHLALFYHLAEFIVNPERQKESQKIPKAQSIHIQDSGMINLGSIGKIKTKYLAGGDMHFTKKKK